MVLTASVLLIVFRLHAFALPLETDEANYAHIAGRLLAGAHLYVEVWDHQPPGVFILFAGASALFGDTPQVFRSLALVFSLVSLGLVFLIVRRSAGVDWAGVGALLFALTSSDPGTAGEGCNREIYMNTLLLAGWFAALHAGGDPSRRASPWWVVASGAAFAAASFLKTIVAIHWIGAAIWLTWREVKSAGPSNGARRRGAVFLALFAAAPMVIWIATFAYFAATQRLAVFVDAVFGFNLSYSRGGDSFWSRFVTFFTPGAAPYLQPFVFDSAMPLWIATLLAGPFLVFLALARRKSETGDDRRMGAAALTLTMLFASYLATCLPAQFWPHYYYLLLPPAIVVTAAALDRLHAILTGTRWKRGMAIACPLVLVGTLLDTQYGHYLSQPPFGITVNRYNGRDFWGRAHGENVRRVTQPDDEIFVYGADAAIYYYAQRRCASRYTMVTALRSGYAGHEERRAIMLNEIEKHRPRLILVVLGEESFPAWKEFLPTRYDPVGWDFRDRAPHDPILMVLCDRERPIGPIEWNWDRSSVGGWNLGETH